MTKAEIKESEWADKELANLKKQAKPPVVVQRVVIHQSLGGDGATMVCAPSGSNSVDPQRRATTPASKVAKGKTTKAQPRATTQALMYNDQAEAQPPK